MWQAAQLLFRVNLPKANLKDGRMVEQIRGHIHPGSVWCKAVRVAGLHPRLFWRCRCAQQNTGWTVVGTLHQQWTHIVLITSSLMGCKIQYRSQHPNRELRASAVRCVEDILQPGPVLFGFCRQIRREWQSCRATVESVLPQWSTQIARRSTKRPGMYF